MHTCSNGSLRNWHINKLPGWFWCTSIFKNHCSRRVSHCSLQRVHTARSERNQNLVKHPPRLVEVWFLVSPPVSLVALLCLHMAPSILNSTLPTANWLILRIPIPSRGLIQLGPGVILAPATCGPGDGRVDGTLWYLLCNDYRPGSFLRKRIEIVISSATFHGALTFSYYNIYYLIL